MHPGFGPRCRVRTPFLTRRRPNPQATPLWTRVVAVLCVWLTMGVTCAEAAHSHLAPFHGGRARLRLQAVVSAAPELCPLCAGFHPLSSSAPLTPLPGAVEHAVFQSRAPLLRSGRKLPFALNCRPPPVLGLRQAVAA